MQKSFGFKKFWRDCTEIKLRARDPSPATPGGGGVPNRLSAAMVPTRIARRRAEGATRARKGVDRPLGCRATEQATQRRLLPKYYLNSAGYVGKPQKSWHPQGESNPCFRRERAMSWTTRRWGRLAEADSYPNRAGRVNRGARKSPHSFTNPLPTGRHNRPRDSVLKRQHGMAPWLNS